MPPTIHLTIPKPCDANWAQMKSEEKSRHCIQCSQSVYSIEDYEESEAMELLRKNVCVRIKANSNGQIKMRTGFSSWLLLSGLLACGDLPDETDLESQIEKPVEVLQVISGEEVKLELQEGTQPPPPPVMGKIVPPSLQERTSVQNEVEVIYEEMGEPILKNFEQSGSNVIEDTISEGSGIKNR